jgi:hypothetical protein
MSVRRMSWPMTRREASITRQEGFAIGVGETPLARGQG